MREPTGTAISGETRSGGPISPSGECDSRFDLVREAFERNFERHGEIGASVCVTYRGEVVVDLVGGFADPDRRLPWTRDTLVMVWSCTKGALALCMHGLAGLGLLDLDAPVSRYWPEFARYGRRGITVAMLLNHQAGLPGIADPLPPGAVFDWQEMTARIARERPRWEPGSRHGYHSFTFGWLVGEVLRRVTGQRPGAFFKEHVAGPLGLDFHIGLEEADDHRVARVFVAVPESAPRSPFRRALDRREPLQISVMNSFGDFAELDVCERREARMADVPAANGISNARGLALMYMPLALGGSIGHLKLSQGSVRRIRAVESASARDAVVRTPTRFSSGFQKATAHRRGWDVFCLPEVAFGHQGFGNSFGFADPDRRISVGYAMNRHAATGENERHQSLIDAIYCAIGYTDLP